METLYIIAFEYRTSEECRYIPSGRPNGKVFYTEEGARKHLAELQKRYNHLDVDGKYYWGIYPVLRIVN